MSLTAIDDFEEQGKENILFSELARIVASIWNAKAEKYLLEIGFRLRQSEILWCESDFVFKHF